MTSRKKRLLLLASSIAGIAGAAAYLLTAGSFHRARAQGTFPADIRRVLEDSAPFTLYSLSPRPGELEAKPGGSRETFHGFTVLGKTVMADPRQRTDLLAALVEGVEESGGSAPPCFNPRHGVHATRDSGSVDLVICFECGQIEVYDRGAKRLITTTRSPQSLFNGALMEAGVPLAGE